MTRTSAGHHITLDRDARRYHTWSCSCGENGDPALLRQTAKTEAMAHVKANDKECLQCGEPLGHEPVNFLDNHNPAAGACHLRCGDAYHAQR